MKAVALSRQRNYDVIHIRDATGLMMFLPQVLGSLFAGQKWVISLLHSERYESFLGAIVASTKIPAIYRFSFKKSSFAYVCQNDKVSEYYSTTFSAVYCQEKCNIALGCFRQ